jgi:deoxyribonucleoside regulator
MSLRVEQDGDIDFRTLPTEQRELLMVQAAKCYYDLDKTMGEIAKIVGLTRWQVGRLLRDAREQGVVRIEIVPRAQRRPELETRLQRAYDLREAIVVPSAGEDDALVADGVAQAAGQFLAALRPRPALVGVSWGRTMAAVAYWLPRHWNPGVEVVLLNGAMNIHASTTRTNNVAELFAQAGDGRATLLPVPAIVGRAETRKVLEQDTVIARVLTLAAQSTAACFGLGGTRDDSVLVQSDYLTPADLATLRARGAVGDVLGRFLNSDGDVVDAALDARTIGLDLSLLREKPTRIGVAVGQQKHAIVLAALRSRLVNVLVTDEGTALAALEAHGQG